MVNLRLVRDQAEAQYLAEAQLPQSMTALKSLHIWIMLQKAFDRQLRQTEALFAEDHRQNLIELQARIHKLIE